MLFIIIPLCQNYKILYLLFKKIITREKNKINYKKTIYNIFIRFFLGIPLWTVVLINEIYRMIIQIKNTKHMNINFLLYEIRNILLKNESSVLNKVRKMKIYYKNDKIIFNPPKTMFSKLTSLNNLHKTKINEINETRQMLSKTPKGVTKPHPTVKNENEEEKFMMDSIKTHSIVQGQKYFYRIDEKGNKDYTTYNDIQNIDIMSINKTKYKPNNKELENAKAYINISRTLDENAGLVYHDKNGAYIINKEGYYHENTLNIGIRNKDTIITEISKKEINEHFNSDISQSKLDTSKIQLQYVIENNIDFSINKKDTLNERINTLENIFIDQIKISDSGFTNYEYLKFNEIKKENNNEDTPD